MDSFDLGRLTDFDFEILCKDLFAEILGLEFEVFSPGADGGIDLRHLSSQSGKVIIQCKHWMRSGRSALITHFKEKEVRKVRKLQPDRYILATTAELTRHSKDSLHETLHPYSLSPGDIFGVDEIASQLRNRPDLVRKHLRLWLNSTAVLETLLNKDVITRSTALAEELNESIRTYAPNQSFSRALEILTKTHVCVIAGLPGIGKTTLARVLAAQHLATGYELVEVSEDVDEVNRLWSPDKPQIFYYDDFLGQTTLADKLNKNEDSRLLSVMRRVSRTPNKRFVLTTREYILAQARQNYARLSMHDFNIMTCVLDLSDYTKVIRAEILYNHVFYANLPAAIKKEFAKPSVYRDIVRHPNFNPRIIAQSLELAHATDPKDVVETVLNNLQSPRTLWEHIVEYELDDTAIHVLLVLFTFAGSVTIETLEESWYAYRATLHLADETREFRKAIDTLEETMVRITPRHNGVFVSYHNPSIRDYMLEYIASQHLAAKRLLASLTKFGQIANLWTLANGWKGAELLAQLSRNPKLVEACIIRLFDQYDEHDQSDWTWKASIALRISSTLDLDGVVQVVMNKFAGNWTKEIWDRRDLVSVVQAVATCKHPIARQEQERIVTQAANWLTNDLSTWEDATDAQQLLDELGIAPYWALTNVEYSIDRLIEEEMDAWMHGSRRDINWRELEEMIDVIDAKYETPDSVFPGYPKAVQALVRHKNDLDAPEDIMWVEDIDDRTHEDEENDVRDIMRHLLNEQPAIISHVTTHQNHVG